MQCTQKKNYKQKAHQSIKNLKLLLLNVIVEIPCAGIYLTNAACGIRGRWVFPTFSFLNHSCLANSRWARYLTPRYRLTRLQVLGNKASGNS